MTYIMYEDHSESNLRLLEMGRGWGMVASPLLYCRTCVSQCCAVAVAMSFVRVLIFCVLAMWNACCEMFGANHYSAAVINQEISSVYGPKKPIQCNEQKRYEHLGFMVGLVCTMKNMLAISGQYSLCMLIFRHWNKLTQSPTTFLRITQWSCLRPHLLRASGGYFSNGPGIVKKLFE